MEEVTHALKEPLPVVDAVGQVDVLKLPDGLTLVEPLSQRLCDSDTVGLGLKVPEELSLTVFVGLWLRDKVTVALPELKRLAEKVTVDVLLRLYMLLPV